MKLFLQYLLLYGCLLLIASPAIAQDERTFQAYQKQAQRYESQKRYKQAIDAYNKALQYSNSENRKQVDLEIARLDESLQEQILVNQGLVNEVERKIQKLGSVANRNRFKNDLAQLKQQDDATKNDFQNLIRQIEAATQAEGDTEDSKIVKTPPVVSPRRASSPTRSPKPSGPPPKTITVSDPGNPINETPKSNRDAKTVKSAGSLKNAGTKSKQPN